MKKKIKSRAKIKKIKTSEVTCLYYTASAFLIPRLRKFKKINISYPCDETSESWNEKIQFIIDSLEARINDSFYDLEVKEQYRVRENSDRAAKLLGEIWFDLWS